MTRFAAGGSLGDIGADKPMIQDERLFDRTDKQNAGGRQQALDPFNGPPLRGPVKVNQEVAAEDEIVAGVPGQEVIAEQVAPVKADAIANGRMPEQIPLWMAGNSGHEKRGLCRERSSCHKRPVRRGRARER